MQPGYEARFFDVDLGQVRRLLHALNAICVTPRRKVRGVVMEDERTRAKGSWISVRTDGPQHVLSYTDQDGEELELMVSDAAVAQQILERLGLSVTRNQESHREEWRLDGLHYLFDEWPGLPPCLEIGGPDAKAVRWAARQLGLDPEQAEGVIPETTGPMPLSAPVVSPPAVSAEPFVVSDLGWSCTQNGWEPGLYRVEWAAVLDNPNRRHYCRHATIHITARDENGQVVGATEHAMPLLPPAGRLAWAGWLETNGPPGSLEVHPRPAEWHDTTASPEQFPPFGYHRVRFVVRGRACSVTGEVVNPYAHPVSMIAITALFRDSTGRLVGGETAFAEDLPAGGTISFKLAGEAPTTAGPVTSLDLVTIPWTSGTDGPWHRILLS
jgi:hypothetical protein